MMPNRKRTTPSVSLKPDEREWLEAKAADAGVSLGRYIRQVALCQRGQDEDKIGAYDRLDELREIKNMLANLTGNWNDIARVANQTNQINPERLDQIGTQIIEATSAITNEMNS